MKEKTYKFLEEELRKILDSKVIITGTECYRIDDCNYPNDENLINFILLKLYKIYCSNEILTSGDLFKDHSAFGDFVVDKCLLLSNIHYGKLNLKKIANDKWNDDFYFLKFGGGIKKKLMEGFVSIVCGAISQQNRNGNNISGVSVLDVGSGRVPYSSILLAEKLGSVNSQDRNFFCTDSLISMGVNPIEQIFDKDTAIDDYSLIVGRYPCSAIKQIVSKCSERNRMSGNKRYLLDVCDCESPTGSFNGYMDYLKLLDPDLKYVQELERDNYDFIYDPKGNKPTKFEYYFNKYRRVGKFECPQTYYVHNLDISDDEIREIIMESKI